MLPPKAADTLGDRLHPFPSGVARCYHFPEMPPTWIRWAAALLALGAVVVLVASSGSDGTSESPTPQPTTTAEGHAGRSEYSNIYFIDVSRRALRQVTDNREEDFADGPAWSRSGKIAFSQTPCEPCPARLFVTRSRGGGGRRIPSDVANLYQPSWSPDGRRIVAARPGSGLYVIDVRDGRARRITRGESDEAPAWSPDGRLIAFHRQVTATNWDIYGVSPTGGRLRRLTRDSLQQLRPTWSPSGTRIGFTEQQRNGNWVIYTMNLDGSDRKRVTDARDSSQSPAWSPDGSRIAFIAQIAGSESIAVVNLDGSGRTRLTGRSLAVTAPGWSPDGRRVVFAAKHVASEGGVVP
jgi:Tol biopolymer transport system component